MSAWMTFVDGENLTIEGEKEILSCIEIQAGTNASQREDLVFRQMQEK